MQMQWGTVSQTVPANGAFEVWLPVRLYIFKDLYKVSNVKEGDYRLRNFTFVS